MREAVRAVLLSPALAFLAAALFLFVVHEPWRDEAQPWLVARDASNMFQELDSETHPALWYVMIYPLAKLGLPFVSLRILHLAIAFVAICLFLLHAPFSRTEKWLYSFGYLVLYEYTTIARNYAILILLLYLVAITWRRRFDKPLLHGALLLLMTQTVGHGVLLAGALSAAYGIEWVLRERARGLPPLAAPALAAVGALLAYAAMAPAPDVAEWRTAWNTTFGVGLLGSVAYAILHAIVPLPRIGGMTWASTWSQDIVIAGALVLLAFAAWTVAARTLRREPRSLGLWLGGSLLLLASYHLKSGINAQARHHGLLFVWFIFCLWVARLQTADPARASPGASRIGAATLAVLLVLQVACLVPAAALDTTRPFSGGPGAARFLIENDYADERTLIGIYPSYAAAAILVHLPPTKTQFWFLQIGEYGSYTRFTHHDAATVGGDIEEMLRAFDGEIARVQPQRAIVIVSYDLGPREDMTLLSAHDGLVGGDDAYIYLRVSGAGGTPAVS